MRVTFPLVLAGLLGLGACGPSEQQIAAATFSVAETATPADLFSETCLRTLPSFSGYEAAVTRRGLQLATRESVGTIYRAPGDKPLTSVRASDRFKNACGVAFLGSPDAAAVGSQFLTEAVRRTGGQPREKLTSSFFHSAYHLRNGSVFTHDVRRSAGQTRRIVLISPPVPKEDIAELIYN
ncbi:hypothetical protein [Roseobacter sinensis]|uniref:Lipoprotein n=1 Tax=Roseobacter sinensis TaxID=2931391 RepID=A0ABT3BF31_9RHOB|nr:hypothetical protein [Roseobacter sp. WL0113]MCV3272191.1 hypothetical protein [Roseobacter sp. WL0113]